MNKDLKMLSLWQPYASLCVWTNPFDGKAEKQIETRHWETSYRGLLAIHATKTLPPPAIKEINTNEQMRAALMRQKPRSWFIDVLKKYMTFGAIIGVVELTDIKQFDAQTLAQIWKDCPERERWFGNYMIGRYGWFLKNHIEFKEPIPCRGLQALGKPPDEVKEQILQLI